MREGGRERGRDVREGGREGGRDVREGGRERGREGSRILKGERSDHKSLNHNMGASDLYLIDLEQVSLQVREEGWAEGGLEGHLPGQHCHHLLLLHPPQLTSHQFPHSHHTMDIVVGRSH